MASKKKKEAAPEKVKRGKPRKNAKRAKAEEKATPSKKLRIGYSGKVTTTIRQNKKVVHRATQHNSGLSNLFRFICYSMAGEYQAAEALRPSSICLCRNPNDDASITENAPYEAYLSGVPVTGLVYTNAPATIMGGTDDGWTITLHFLVPHAYIGGDGSFNQVNLYSKSASSAGNTSSACAFFFMTTKNKEGATIWDTVETTNESGDDYSVTIDWEMTFSNIDKTNNETEGGNKTEGGEEGGEQA